MSFIAIFTVFVTLSTLGMFGLLLLNLNYSLKMVQGQVRVTIFLKNGLSKEAIQDVGKRLSALNIVKDVKFISKNTAYRRLQEELGREKYILSTLEYNPLPDSFEVKLVSPMYASTLSRRVLSWKEVSEVVYAREIVDKLIALIGIVKKIGIAVVFILGLAALLIIVNTIRLMVLSRQEEIEIMKLVGATSWFIRMPFVIEGVFQSFIGAALSSALIFYGYVWLVKNIVWRFPFIPLVLDAKPILYVIVVVVIFGVLVGLFGSLLAIQRFVGGRSFVKKE